MENITLAELNASTDGEEDQQVGSVVAGQGGSTGFGGGRMGGQGGGPGGNQGFGGWVPGQQR